MHNFLSNAFTIAAIVFSGAYLITLTVLIECYKNDKEAEKHLRIK